ncbi:MAG: hypothetical protein WC759_02830 [Candidatus Micrarchaeia archaeon]|jgi:hypothetical protein
MTVEQKDAEINKIINNPYLSDQEKVSRVFKIANMPEVTEQDLADDARYYATVRNLKRVTFVGGLIAFGFAATAGILLYLNAPPSQSAPPTNPSFQHSFTETHALDIPKDSFYRHISLSGLTVGFVRTNNGSRLEAYDATSGVQQWSAILPGEATVDTMVSPSGDRIYVPMYERKGSDDITTLYCLDSAGQVKWANSFFGINGGLSNLSENGSVIPDKIHQFLETGTSRLRVTLNIADGSIAEEKCVITY